MAGMYVLPEVKYEAQAYIKLIKQLINKNLIKWAK